MKKGFTPKIQPKGPSKNWLWGLHAARAALANPSRQIHGIYVTTSVLDEFDIPEKRSPALKILSNLEISNLLPEGAVHQGIALHVADLNEPAFLPYLKTLDENAKVVVLDHVTDPHNVGAIIRTCAALGAKALIMTERHSPQLTGALAKSACGALEILPIFKITNLARSLQDLKDCGFWTVGLAEEGATYISETDLTGKIALIMGAEGEGLRRLTREHCDYMVKLKTSDDFSTLNVSVATALALYELVR